MRGNVRASLSAIAASALLAFVGPEVGVAAAPAATLALPPTLPSAHGPQEVDVELVLAIDVSGSIDYQEAELQRKGIAEEFIHTLITAERHSGRGTSISDALELSQRMLERGPYRSAKQIIDVSGDGVNNAGRRVLEVRDETL